MIVVLSETLSQKTSINARESLTIAEAARMFGSRLYPLPSNWDDFDDLDNVLAYVPTFTEPTLGVWVGVIPSSERYKTVYGLAMKKNIYLANTPEQHRTAMEFDRFYPLLEGITPKSVIVDDLSQLDAISDMLSFPVFVKGAIKSNKDEGWSAVVAQNRESLLQLAQATLARPHRARGKVIVRELVSLNTVATDPNGFPIGREYRAFLYKGDVLAYGFYWEDYDDPQPLSGDDRTRFIACLQEVAERVDAPFISVDIRQLKTGEWCVIEIGDAQFSGLSQIPILELWSKITGLKL